MRAVKGRSKFSWISFIFERARFKMLCHISEQMCAAFANSGLFTKVSGNSQNIEHKDGSREERAAFFLHILLVSGSHVEVVFRDMSGNQNCPWTFRVDPLSPTFWPPLSSHQQLFAAWRQIWRKCKMSQKRKKMWRTHATFQAFWTLSSHRPPLLPALSSLPPAKLSSYWWRNTKFNIFVHLSLTFCQKSVEDVQSSSESKVACKVIKNRAAPKNCPLLFSTEKCKLIKNRAAPKIACDYFHQKMQREK